MADDKNARGHVYKARYRKTFTEDGWGMRVEKEGTRGRLVHSTVRAKLFTGEKWRCYAVEGWVDDEENGRAKRVGRAGRAPVYEVRS